MSVHIPSGVNYIIAIIIGKSILLLDRLCVHDTLNYDNGVFVWKGISCVVLTGAK